MDSSPIFMKLLKRLLIGLVLLSALLFGAFKYFQGQTKKHSPEARIGHEVSGSRIEVFYCRPSVKGREIFGGLVPYGEVWRTGANEATTFENSAALRIGGQNLPAGKYSLWTMPGKESWSLIFNRKMYPWGVSFGEKASREAEHDALQLTAPVQTLSELVEQFTIRFVGDTMLLEWERSRIAVPLAAAP